MKSLRFLLTILILSIAFAVQGQQPNSPYKVKGKKIEYAGNSFRAYGGIYYISPNVIAVNKVFQKVKSKASNMSLMGTGIEDESKAAWGFVDATGKKIIPFKYTDIQILPNMVMVWKGKKRGFVSKDGKIIIDAILDDVLAIRNGYSKIKVGDNSGLISSDGRIILQPVYNGFDFVANGRLLAVQVGGQLSYTAQKEYIRTGARIGFADTTGKILVQPVYDDMVDMDAKTGLLQVIRNGKSGLLSIEGNEVLAPKYDWINTSVLNGYLQVRIKDKWGIIDTTGREVIAPEYEGIFSLGDELFAIKQNDKWGVIHLNGNQKVQQEYETIATMYDGKILVKKDNKWGIVDSSGYDIVEPKYDRVDHNVFSKGFLPVREKKQILLVDPEGRELLGDYKTLQTQMANGAVWERRGDAWKLNGVTYRYDRLRWFSPQMTIAYKDEKAGLVDFNGKELTAFEYDTIRPITNTLACVAKGRKNGLVNAEGKLVLPIKYYFVTAVGHGICAVCDAEAEVIKKNGFPTKVMVCKWGFADSTGKIIVEPKYDNYEGFVDGYAPIMLAGKKGLIDSTGKVIIEPKYDKFTAFQGTIAFVKDKDKWGIVDNTGREIAEPKYDDDWHVRLKTTPDKIRLSYHPKFYKGYALIFEGRKYGLIDSTGKQILEPVYDQIDIVTYPDKDVVALIKKKSKWGMVDGKGYEVVKPQYFALYEHTDGLARASMGPAYGYLDKKGEKEIDFYFNKAGLFNNGWAPVSINGRYFLVDTGGTPMYLK